MVCLLKKRDCEIRSCGGERMGYNERTSGRKNCDVSRYTNQEVDIMQEREVQFHIQCGPGQVGKYCILPGDPGRCQAIAQYFDDPVHVQTNREYVTYTGTLLGSRSAWYPPGSAAPPPLSPWRSCVIWGSIPLCEWGPAAGSSWRSRAAMWWWPPGGADGGTSREYAPIEYPAVPDYQVLTALTAAAERLGSREGWGGAVQGLLLWTALPGRMPVSYELEQKWEAWKRLGVLASEMESAALFTVAAARGVRCGSVFHVIWNQEREKAGLDQKESHDTSAAIQVGVEAVKLLIRQDRERA